MHVRNLLKTKERERESIVAYNGSSTSQQEQNLRAHFAKR